MLSSSQSDATIVDRPTSLKEKAILKLAQLATHPSLNRAVTVYCQPFISSAELENVVGQQNNATITESVQMYTIVL